MTSTEPISSAGRRDSVSVIVPTRNEAGNVQVLAERLVQSLTSIDSPWELVFVDDSDDETPDRIQSLRRKTSMVRLVHRAAEERHGGLAGAVVDGFAVAEGTAIVVMDGDLQHPPEIVPLLIAPVLSGSCSIAVGSRYVGAARSAGLAGPYRRSVSQVSRGIVRSLFPAISGVRDPLSGFFALRREVIADASLAPEGFKILLEVLIRGNWNHVREIPYEFAARRSGGSKAGWNEGTQFVRQMLRLRLSRDGSERPAASASARSKVTGSSYGAAPDNQVQLAMVSEMTSSAGIHTR